jgi:hypothetical protein
MRALGLAALVAVLASSIACGGAPASVASVPPADDDPATAAPSPKGKRWAGWRYAGDREECFYVVGRKCFDDKVEACEAADCAEGTRCTFDGAGPAQVRCE